MMIMAGNNNKKQKPPDNLKGPDPRQAGSSLVYVLALLVIFGLLGAATVSLFTSSTMMSSGVPNYAKRASSLSESGMRYAISELRNSGYAPSVISRLNTTPYTLDDAGSFDLNVFGKWFEAAGDYDQTSGTISLSVPEGEITKLFTIPQNAYLINLESFRDSIYFGGGAPNSKFSAQVQTAPAPAAGSTTLSVALDDDFQATASQGHRMLLAVHPSATVTIGSGDADLQIEDTGWVDPPNTFFPKKNGAVYLVDSAGLITQYFYEEMVQGSTVLKLKSLPSAVTIKDTDFVILSDRNHSIESEGLSGSIASGGDVNLAMDFLPNITSPQEIPPPEPLALPPDISPETLIPGLATPAESRSDAVTVNTGAGTVTLGGGGTSGAGAVFFGGTVSVGGLDVCTGGKCDFNNGVRAFFTLKYTGTGDGFTFALVNGDNNTTADFGGTGGAMGYAGTSPTGEKIEPPKLALEFDTYTNAVSNDPGTNNKDYLQYVYWGGSSSSSADDNIHDSGGFGQKWRRWLTGDNVRNRPAVNPDTGNVYISNYEYLFGLDPIDGSDLFTETDLRDYSFSSPAIGSDGTIYVGSNTNFYSPFLGRLFAINPSTGAEIAGFGTGSNVRSSIVLDSNDHAYFGTDTADDFFYATYPTTPPTLKWKYPLKGSTPSTNVDGFVALSPDESTVYFVSPDPGGSGDDYLYALYTSAGASPRFKWRFSLGDSSESDPRVADDGTIYIGSDDDYIYAITDGGTSASMKWRYRTGGKVKCRPAVGTDGTIYIGSDDNYLYALTDEGSSGSLKWRFSTGGHVKGSPLVHDDGTIWFGSDDDYFYVLDSEGRQLDRYDLGRNVQCPASQGPDGSVYVGSDDDRLYAFSPSCQPRNAKEVNFTYEDLPAGTPISDTDDWLGSDGTHPWAVRMEVTRSTTLNARNKYEYTLKMWIRQCGEADCSDVLGTYFEDTRIAYAAKEVHLEQAIELCEADHLKFNTFLFGFTEGTGGATQVVTLSEIELGFIRPGDPVITTDPDWP